MHYLFFFLLLFGCAPSSVEEYQAEGEALQRLLAKELKSIHSVEELRSAVPRLRYRFNQLVDLAIDAERNLSDVDVPSPSNGWSEALRVEVLRIYAWEGGRELLEAAEREALTRLDLFMKEKEAKLHTR